MKSVQLGSSDLSVSPICLGTMTFGEQVDQATAFAILDRALELGVNFIDTAEMYAVPARAETYTATETIIGHWLSQRPGVRQKLVLATKVAGPSRSMPWVRGGSADLTGPDIIAACDASLKRLQTDVIDLYQIHWPVRSVPMFGGLYFQPSETEGSSIHAQLEALGTLVKAGKVRAVGLSNETPYGVHEFVRLAEQHRLPRIATVQNAYHLLNRSVENALDETLYRLNVSLLAYSPLSFGLLTGKYDATGLTGPGAPAEARLTKFESMRKQRWGRAAAQAAALRYNALAREHGLTPTQLALAFCYKQWRVSSTILGVTSVAQLEENVAVWGTQLSEVVLRQVDDIRWDMRDPAM
ncbi:aldo/keto reductase [Rhodoferax sp. U11-2br]|uniref:aldo/keto reductase n=1 Tax=Rhodoferax sp. U11-2br TaxID=2838878 RepID=UPI001BE7C947|nr:aldo/keto reductase [Rhodoferax sp. U11-2br]MBT3067104.1 aldo/keto reductase [Rhodoferax sp. U11-2br]